MVAAKPSAPAKKTAAKKSPAGPAPKSAVKRAQAKQVKSQAAVKKAVAKRAPTRKELLAADLPVARSGLSSVTHDELNPAFKL